MTRVPINQKQGFTLVELLVGMVVLAIMVVLCANIITTTSSAWKRAEQKTSAFQSARLAFESMTLALSQATLNPYWDYVDSSGSRRTTNNVATFNPVSYDRASDLHFLVMPAPAPAAAANIPTFTSLPNSPAGSDAMFFQVPSGYASDTALRPLGNLLNSVGFFIQFGSDQAWRPPFITEAITPYKYRYRLMQLFESAGNNHVYSTYDWITPGKELSTRWKWISDALTATPSSLHPLADNIVTLIIVPRGPVSGGPDNSPLAANYLYDSRDATTPSAHSQLPPFVEIIMVAIDEPSALRLAAAQTDPTSAPDLAPNFHLGSLFQQVDSLDADLSKLETALADNHIDYRVFRTTVRIDSSRWSK